MNANPLSQSNPYRGIVRAIASALQAEDGAELSRQLAFHREVHHSIETLLTPPGIRQPLSLRGGAHSKHYMVELLPHIQSLLRTLPRDSLLRVLDVGPGVVHGTELLASLYRYPELGYRLDVTALDVVPTFHYYSLATCPNVRHLVTTLEDLKETFDIVIASHVLEHVESPISLCEQMQSKATMAVFVTAPYEEPPHNLTRGHRHSLGQDFLDSIEADERYVYHSPAWGAMKDPPYEVFIARLPGRAERPDAHEEPAHGELRPVAIPERLIEGLQERTWAFEQARPTDPDTPDSSEAVRADPSRTRRNAVAGGSRGVESGRRPTRPGSISGRALAKLASKFDHPRDAALLDLGRSAKVLLTGSRKPVRNRHR